MFSTCPNNRFSQGFSKYFKLLPTKTGVGCRRAIDDVGHYFCLIRSYIYSHKNSGT